MAAETDDFRTLLRDALAGSQDAAAALCQNYQSHILRVVRRRLMQRMRSRVDSVDLVQDVWASFFAKPPGHLHFDEPAALVAYLEQMAQFRVGEVIRQQTGRDADINRELSGLTDGKSPVEHLPASQPTPSQIFGAEDEWQRMLHGRPPLHQHILHLLRHGMTHAEIAGRLQTDIKTIQRLIRRVERHECALDLLRQGLTHAEIAARLGTDTKAIQRLLRLEPEAAES